MRGCRRITIVQAAPTHGSPGTGRSLQLHLKDVKGDVALRPPHPIYRAKLNGIITITVTIQGWNVSSCEATVVYDKKYLKIIQGSDTISVPITAEGRDASWSFQTLEQTESLEIKVKAEANGLTQESNIIMEVG